MKKVICMLILGFAASSSASTSYELSGKLVRIGRDSFVVQSSDETREISRGAARLPEHARVGDDATVWYTLDARKVEIRKPTQQPGQAAPQPQRDDRIYYEG